MPVAKAGGISYLAIKQLTPLMTKQYFAAILASSFLFLNGCKKDDSDGTPGTTTNTVSVIPPPAGFTFPHTYFQTSRSTDFKVWFKGADITTKCQVETMFPDEEELPDFNVKLLDTKLAQFIDPTGGNDPETTKYFFSANTFNIITDDSIPDTIAFGTGNYSGFTVSSSSFYVTKEYPGGRQSIGGGTLTPMTYKAIIDYANIEDPDTVAYFNSTVTLK
jgi:hypothetical protein